MLKQLKTLVRDFMSFVREDFHLAAYTYTVSVAGLCVLFIYCTDFGDKIADNMVPTSNAVVNNIIMFAALYFAIAIPTQLFRGKFREIPKFAFFAKGILLMSLIGFADAFSWKDVLNLSDLSLPEQSYILKVLWRMRNLIFVLPAFVLLRIFVDKDVRGLYGLCRGNHHIKAYLFLYAIILPILTIVSFTPDFQSYYPMYKSWDYGEVFGRSTGLNALLFETVYMGDFLMVELIFRGMLVIGMASVLGRGAVLPMIVVYVALHFGKPVSETCSALFGGYFLGAIAYQTRHIWGGVIIHMGIALAIELLRFFQHYLLCVG